MRFIRNKLSQLTTSLLYFVARVTQVLTAAERRHDSVKLDGQLLPIMKRAGGHHVQTA